MLKDMFTKLTKKEKEEISSFSDKLKNNILDGFIDIKAYKKNELIYHDAGDNTVTDWMRQAILILLTGDSFSSLGNKSALANPINGIVSSNHIENTYNGDGYLLNGQKFLWAGDNYNGFYSESTVSENNLYPLFPTKILLGTGKEYASWAEVQADISLTYPANYSVLEIEYGDILNASTTFNGLGDTAISNPVNVYSGTLENGNTFGNSNIKKARTVNDPNPAKGTDSSYASSEYGIVGAIKTLYTNLSSDASKLDFDLNLKPEWKGIGRPAFIYLNTPALSLGSKSEIWTDPFGGSEVLLSKDETGTYLNKITFTVTMPDQTTDYYPYNGFTLKQIGLFCDGKFSYDATIPNTGLSQYNNMPNGIMLAKKNITPFTKTAEVKIILQWILSI